MDADLMAVLTDIKADQRLLFSKIDAIDGKIGKLPCPVNTYKITLLQRIVFTGIGIVLLAFMTSLVSDSDVVKKKETRVAKTSIITRARP